MAVLLEPSVLSKLPKRLWPEVRRGLRDAAEAENGSSTASWLSWQRHDREQLEGRPRQFPQDLTQPPRKGYNVHEQMGV
jgi:hypothetical protein